MKNIHLIETDKKSKLAFYQENSSCEEPILQLVSHTSSDYKYQNIYITSDEKIKEGDYWIYICLINGLDYGNNNNPIVKNNLPATWFEKLHDKKNYKKIILTTDQNLIKNGVQAINNEFLEWFVKNPNCDSVDVTEIVDAHDTTTKSSTKYKITIPKIEIDYNKEKILEKAAEKYVTEDNNNRYYNDFIAGAKWQQEQNKELYNEEKIKKIILCFLHHSWNTKENKMKQEFDDWFKQFKYLDLL